MIEGVKVPMGEVAVFAPEMLEYLVVVLPEVRAPLRPLANEKDAAFVRSIATQGQLEPGGFRENANDDVEIIFGAGRLWAIRDYINQNPAYWGARGPMSFQARKVVVRSDAEVLDLLRSENDCRREPSIVQRAYACVEYERLGLTQAQVADKMGLTPPRVSQILAILKHCDRVKDLISGGRLNEPQSRRLLKADGDVVAEVCGRIEAGEKAGAVLKSVADRQRAGGRVVPRSMGEMLKALKPLASQSRLAARLLRWSDGGGGEAELRDIILAAEATVEALTGASPWQ
jgi:hypothetical protein